MCINNNSKFSLTIALSIFLTAVLASHAQGAYNYDPYSYLYDEIDYDYDYLDGEYDDYESYIDQAEEDKDFSERLEGADSWDEYYAEASHVYSDISNNFRYRLRNFFDFVHSVRLVIEDVGKDWYAYEWDFADDHQADDEHDFNGSISLALTKAFGGATYDEQTATYETPSTANDWAGFRGKFHNFFPLNFKQGGQIHFTASSEQPVNIKFLLKSKFKRHKHIKTDNVLITGECATYSVDIPASGSSVFKSLYMFIVERDQPVTVENLVIGNDLPSCSDGSTDGNTDGDDSSSDDSTYDNAGGDDSSSDDSTDDNTGGDDSSSDDSTDDNTSGDDSSSDDSSDDNTGDDSNSDDSSDDNTGGDDSNADNSDSDGDITPLQSIVVSNQPTGLLGENTELEITYNASDNNNQLSGLGIRIHFDSSILTFNTLSDVLQQDIIVNGEGPISDAEDFDNDPQTDSYLTFGWASLFNNWPNTDLPSVIINVTFGVSSSIDTEVTSSTPINFTGITTAAGYGFETETYNLELVETESTWDFDGNGDADALTDGLIMMRYSFGLRGDSMANNVMAADSVMSASQVEERMQNAMKIADIDDDGQVDALTDGLILLRHLFFVEDETLTHGVIGASASRKTRVAIKQHLNKHMPKKRGQQND